MVVWWFCVVIGGVFVLVGDGVMVECVVWDECIGIVDVCVLFGGDVVLIMILLFFWRIL